MKYNLLVLTFLLPVACKKEPNFSSAKKIEASPSTEQISTTRQSTNTGQQVATPDQPGVTSTTDTLLPRGTSSTPCSEQQTQLNLLTPQLQNSSSNMVVRVEISIGSCGITSTSMVGPIYFDMKVKSNIQQQISYEIEGITSGIFSYTAGHDLFKQQGPTYGYFKAAQFPLTTSANSVVLAINLGSQTLFPDTPGENSQTPGSFTAPLTIKMGALQPFTTKVQITGY